MERPADVPGYPTLTLKMRDVRVYAGNLAQFSCSFDGQPFSDIVWDHNGRTVTVTERVNCSQRGDLLSLTIHNVQLTDVGSYRCSVKNNIGENRTSAQLSVQGGYFHILHICGPFHLIMLPAGVIIICTATITNCNIFLM